MPMFRAEATVFTVGEKGSLVNVMLKRFQQDEMTAAMGVFLKAALTKIPIRTGFLRYAFRPLQERFMKGATETLPNPGRAGRDRNKEYYYYGRRQRILKTSVNARKFVKPQNGNVLKVDGDTSTLLFDIDISYYRINDNFSRITGSPWRSMDTGMQAMLNYLENAAARFPNINQIMVATRIYLRGENVGRSDNIAADYRGTWRNA